jgi:hypothetical protein
MIPAPSPIAGDEHEAKAMQQALVATGHASEATAELARFAREGVHARACPFSVDVVTELLDAARLAIEIEVAIGRYDAATAASLLTLRDQIADHMETAL